MFSKTLILVAAAAGALSAGAAVNPEDFTPLNFDTEYTVEKFKPFMGKLTPDTDGTVIEYGTIAAYTLGADNELDEVSDWSYAGYINGKQAYQFSATAGTTYYIYSSFVMDNGVISFALNPGVKITETSPAIGEVYDPARMEFAEVTFNQNITIGKATLEIGTNSSEVTLRESGSSFSMLIRDVMMQWFDAELIKGGETMTLTLSDIKDASGNQCDDIKVEFIAGNKPYRMVDYHLPATIYSYMEPGSNDTKATFTFDGPMGDNPDIQLCYSPIELGYEYYEPMAATVEGNTITVDFAGKLRTPESMSPTGVVSPTIDIRLFSIKDARNQIVLAGQGSIGSFHFQTDYAYVPTVEFSPLFMPEHGASLANETEVTITFDNASEIEFSGVTFSSGTEKVTVDKKDLTISEGKVTASIPEGWNTKANVYVSLEGLVSTDGQDHSNEFTVKYNGFALTFSNPSANSKLASLLKGRTITIDTNLTGKEPVEFAILDGETAVYGPVNMTLRSEGQYLHAMESDVILYASGDYCLRFAAQNSVETISIEGTSADFEYSPVELESITPETGSQLDEPAQIKVTFNGLAAIERFSGSAAFTATPASGEAVDGYDTAWVINLESLGSESTVTVKFQAIDQDFKVIKGNDGIESSSCFTLTYNVKAGIAEISATNEKSIMFDLNGRRVNSAHRGIYILNGKKTLIK